MILSRSLNFGDKIWVYAQIKLDRIHQVGMTYVIREGESSDFIVMCLPFLRRKIKKITMKIYRKVQSI